MKTKKIAICPKCWSSITDGYGWKLVTSWKNFKCPYPSHNFDCRTEEEKQNEKHEAEL